jgi:hypothetical protein
MFHWVNLSQMSHTGGIAKKRQRNLSWQFAYLKFVCLMPANHLPRRNLKKSFHPKWRQVIVQEYNLSSSWVAEKYESAVQRREEMEQKYLQSQAKEKKYYNT